MQMTVRDALNSAMDEEMARDESVYILGEEVCVHGCLKMNGASNGAHFISCYQVSPAVQLQAHWPATPLSIHWFHVCPPMCSQVGEYQGAYKVGLSHAAVRAGASGTSATLHVCLHAREITRNLGVSLSLAKQQS